MSGPWRPRDYRDTFTTKVAKLIEDKRKGREIVAEEPPPDPTDVVDLMEALRRSVEGAMGSRGGGRKAKASTRSRRSAASDVDGARKAELDRLARELDIKGRSTMKREELAAAVKKKAKAAS